MAIQQNVNQILSLSAVFARMSPLGDIASHNKDVKTAKDAYDKQVETTDNIMGKNSINQIPAYENRLEAAKRLYQLEPTEKLARDISATQNVINDKQNRIAKNAADRQEMAAKKAAADSMNAEKARQDADRAREARLKILEGIPLSTESENYTKKLLESNTPSGQPLKEMEEKE